MRSNFDKFFRDALQFEGTAYEDVAADRGGPTKCGITIGRVAQVKGVKLPKRDAAGWDQLRDAVRDLSMEDVEAIYRSDYWAAVGGDDLPSGLDYAVADYGLNSGPSRAVKYLQRIVGTPQTGKLDHGTIATVNDRSPTDLINDYCDARAKFLVQIVENDASQAKFKKGWLVRVASVRKTALRLVGDEPATPRMGKAELPDEPVTPDSLAPISRKVETTQVAQGGAAVVAATGGLIELAPHVQAVTEQIGIFKEMGMAVAGFAEFAKDHFGIVLLILGCIAVFHYRKQLWLMVDDFKSGRWTPSGK